MATLLNSKINCIHLGTNSSNSTTSTAFGYCTNCGNGNHNTILGHCSGVCLLSTGCRNTIIGANSGKAITSGTDNTLIGDSIDTISNSFRNTILRNFASTDSLVLNDNNNNNTILVSGGCNGVMNSNHTNFCGNVIISNAGGPSYGYLPKSMCNIFIGLPGVYQYQPYQNNCGSNIINISADYNYAKRFLVGYNYGGDCSINIGGSTNAVPYCNSIAIGGDPSGANIIDWPRITCNCTYVSWIYGSDCRDKTNVETLPNNLGLNFIRKLRPVSFKWDRRQEYVDKCDFEFGQKDGTLTENKTEYGFIAQEVKTAIEELNAEFTGLNYNSEKDIYTMGMRPFLPVIVKALQELDNRVKALKIQVINNP